MRVRVKVCSRQERLELPGPAPTLRDLQAALETRGAAQPVVVSLNKRVRSQEGSVKTWSIKGQRRLQARRWRLRR